MLQKEVPMTKSRRKYTREFKLEAVKMMVEQDRSAGDVGAMPLASKARSAAASQHSWRSPRFVRIGAASVVERQRIAR